MAERNVPLHHSNQVHKAVYDDEAQLLKLTLNGKTYGYQRVPQEKVAGLSKAPSHGDYFHKNIRGKHNFYPIS
jgi:hypothetical protein